MSTITREWVALHSVRDLKFQDILLSAKTSTTQRISKLLIPQVDMLAGFLTDVWKLRVSCWSGERVLCDECAVAATLHA